MGCLFVLGFESFWGSGRSLFRACWVWFGFVVGAVLYPISTGVQLFG